ncbi:hypothetical protein HGM15179_010693 [Zosterops borbonicus]|uniref:Uncharacterized protein n=1 Tax=Zosterops borbonicus TaxID=364589 RepID=A0A8K1GD00_9PASS|nr:hypothetical protein HGM15179_010693 [Zosterops borbonicus]
MFASDLDAGVECIINRFADDPKLMTQDEKNVKAAPDMESDQAAQVHDLFMLGTPELDESLQVESIKTQQWNPIPQLAGHTALDAAQDAVGFLRVDEIGIVVKKEFLLALARK